MTRPLNAVLFGVFTLTGFSALTLQVLWQRVISLHAGVDLFSITTVVAAFLAGLGLGSVAGGVLADRLGARRSLLAFAASEAGVGLSPEPASGCSTTCSARWRPASRAPRPPRL